MSQYETDDEKVEAIKNWWRENGLSVAVGIGIGLALVFGWRAWSDYRSARAAHAAAGFEQVLNGVSAGDPATIAKQADQLVAEYDDTPYAALAALAAAKAHYEAGNSAGAITALQQVIAAPPDPGLARLAAVRLARIQLADGQLDAAAATVTAHDDGQSFVGDFAAVRGDIAAARGDTAQARFEYERALQADSGQSQLIRLKLDNLPPAG